MRLLFAIALRHLLARKRQSIVSLLGIVIGVAFFLAISSMMQGSQRDFLKRLVDNAPHITVYDTYRDAIEQPVKRAYPGAVIELRSIKPKTENRGIRGYRQALATIRSVHGVRASATLTGQGIVNFAGREDNIVLNGMAPEEMRDITTIDDQMVQGSIDNLITNRNGIIVGVGLLRKMSVAMGENISVVASGGGLYTFKIVGVFRTGRSSYDETQTFVDLKRVQSLTNRHNRANSIIIKIDDPQQARLVAADIESRIGYKTVSWQEANEDIINTLFIRNTIMYSVVSAVLVVAAFGIYNIISTVVIEKHRDIAILKSIGFRRRDIRYIFVIQGLLLGLAGNLAGLPLGCALMVGLGQIKFRPPGMDRLSMPLEWSLPQFLIAGAFAIGAALLAAWLPARKGAQLLPVNILRGAQ